MSWIKSSLKVIFYNFLFVLGVLALLEIVTRFMFPETWLFNRFHSPVHYGDYNTRRLRPNTVFYHQTLDGRWEYRINVDGFRMDKDVLVKKQVNHIRVMMLGDSHTQGMEVNQDETFSFLLNGRSCKEKQLEIINTGISGSGTSEHLILLMELGKKYKPDYIIEAFYPNDLDNNLSGFHQIEANNLVEITKTHPSWTGLQLLDFHNDFFIMRWLSQHSFLYSLMLNKGWELGKKILGVNQDDYIEQVKNEPQSSFENKLKLFNLLLEEMSIQARLLEAKFMLINIPSIIDYNIEDYLYKSNSPLLDKVTFPENTQLHVSHGYHHINHAAHKIIAEAVYKSICR